HRLPAAFAMGRKPAHDSAPGRRLTSHQCRPRAKNRRIIGTGAPNDSQEIAFTPACTATNPIVLNFTTNTMSDHLSDKCGYKWCFLLLSARFFINLIWMPDQFRPAPVPFLRG